MAERPRCPASKAANMASGGGGEVEGSPEIAPAELAPSAAKGKSCKGCLFYSSVLKSRARGPVCVGITRTIPNVPSHMVGEIELEAAQEGRNLSNFKYACAGYSIFLEDKDNYAEKGEKRAELPICVGIELLADTKTSTSQAPAHLNKDAHSQSRLHKPGHVGEDFMSKFHRNAGLVASGVARNLNKVGTYIKDTVDDILYPYRRRPK